jgi:hypothetical protein
VSRARGRRRLLVVTGVGALIGLLLPSLTNASDSRHYKTYLTCDTFGFHSVHRPAKPSHVCSRDDSWGGIFISKHKSVVHYRFCARRPDRSHICYRRQTFQHWETDGLWGTTGFQQSGRYTFSWRVGGHSVDRDRFWLRP